MPLKKIRLDLARDEDFPAGSAYHGYEFVAPLDESGRINAEEWEKKKDRCRVVRFWGGAERELGHLVKRGSDWAFHYRQAGDIDVADEGGYRLGHHVFRPGEYVSIREDDETMRTYRVVLVSDVPE